MNGNQNPNQDAAQQSDRQPAEGGARKGVRIGGAVATGLFVSALVFGVYSITSTGGDDDRSDDPPSAAASPGSGDVADDPPSDDEPDAGDVRVDDADGALAEPDEGAENPNGDPSTDPADLNDAGPTPDPVGLSNLCVNVVHGDASSGIWVRGEVYGLESGWIYVEAETVNGGEPVEVPVESGTFDSPLPILRYGDHEVTRFELVADGPEGIPVDLMPALLDGPGAVFPVDADEGPVFESECFDIEPVAPNEGASATPGASEAALVDAFLDDFVEDHRTGDVAGLLATLHPAIPLSFGDDVCTDYVNRTTGSIADATVVEVGQIGPLELATANGPIGFPEAIPFTVEFTLTDGSSTINEAHLPLDDGTVHWLTTCGVDVP